MSGGLMVPSYTMPQGHFVFFKGLCSYDGVCYYTKVPVHKNVMLPLCSLIQRLYMEEVW